MTADYYLAAENDYRRERAAATWAAVRESRARRGRRWPRLPAKPRLRLPTRKPLRLPEERPDTAVLV